MARPAIANSPQVLAEESQDQQVVEQEPQADQQSENEPAEALMGDMPAPDYKDMVEQKHIDFSNVVPQMHVQGPGPLNWKAFPYTQQAKRTRSYAHVIEFVPDVAKATPEEWEHVKKCLTKRKVIHNEKGKSRVAPDQDLAGLPVAG